MFKPSDKVKYVSVKEWSKSLTPAQRAAQDAILKGPHPWRPIISVPDERSKAVLPELPEHPLGVYAKKFGKRVKQNTDQIDPITRVSEGITEEGREVVNEWRGRPC